MKNAKIMVMLLGLMLLICTWFLTIPLNKRDTVSNISILDKVESGNKTDRSSKETSFDFRLNDSNGIPHSLSDYRGKKVYLKYWASWCPICLAGMDEFDELVKNNVASEQVVILSIVAPDAFGEKSADEFVKWYKERGYTNPVLLDDGGVVAKKIGIRAFPTSIYLDVAGTIIAINPGQVSNEIITSKMAAF